MNEQIPLKHITISLFTMALSLCSSLDSAATQDPPRGMAGMYVGFEWGESNRQPVALLLRGASATMATMRGTWTAIPSFSPAPRTETRAGTRTATAPGTATSPDRPDHVNADFAIVSHVNASGSTIAPPVDVPPGTRPVLRGALTGGGSGLMRLCLSDGQGRSPRATVPAKGHEPPAGVRCYVLKAWPEAAGLLLTPLALPTPPPTKAEGCMQECLKHRQMAASDPAHMRQGCQRRCGLTAAP